MKEKGTKKWFCTFLAFVFLFSNVVGVITAEAKIKRNVFVYVFSSRDVGKFGYSGGTTGYYGEGGQASNGYKIYRVAPGAKIYATFGYDMENGSLNPSLGRDAHNNTIDESIAIIEPTGEGGYDKIQYKTIEGTEDIKVVSTGSSGYFPYYMEFPETEGIYDVKYVQDPSQVPPQIAYLYGGGSRFICGSNVIPNIKVTGYEDNVTVTDNINIVDVYKTTEMDLKATVTPSEAWQGVSWSSSDSSIATIDSKTGHVTFTGKVGDVVFYATSTTVVTNNKARGSVTLSVRYPIPIVSINQQFGNMILVAGEQPSGIKEFAMSDTPTLDGLVWQPSGLFTLHGAGKYYFFAKANDGTISKAYEHIVPDVESPIIQNVEVTDYTAVIRATDDVGIFGYGYSLKNDANTVANWQISDTFTNLVKGATYYAFAKDEVGHISNSYQFVVENSSGDKDSPIVTTVNQIITETSKGATIIATDDVGVTGYGVSENTNTSGITWKSTNTFTNLKGGTVYYAFAKDAADNISDPYEFVIGTQEDEEDTEAPIVVGTKEVAGSQVRITATDNIMVTGYGIAQTNNPNAATWKVSNTFKSGNSGGQYYAFAKDAAGNISEPFPFTIGGDLEAPVITKVDVTGTKAVVSATDNIGVTRYAVSTENSSGSVSWQSSNVFDNLEEGTSYYAFAKDAAGNVSSGKQFATEVKADTEAPTISKVDLSGTDAVVTAEDNIGVTKYALSETNNADEVSWQDSNRFADLKEGTTYYAFAKDEAGNVSDSYEFTVPAQGDTEAPVITRIGFEAKGVQIFATDNVGVTKYGISESPDASTASWKSSSLFTSPVSGKTYYAFAMDEAGNISEPYEFIKQ